MCKAVREEVSTESAAPSSAERDEDERDEASARRRLQAGEATHPPPPPTRERQSPAMFIRGPWRACAILALILAVPIAQHRSTFAQSPGPSPSTSEGTDGGSDIPAPSTPTPTPTPAPSSTPTPTAPEPSSAAIPAMELKGILDLTITDRGYDVKNAQGKAIHVVATADIPDLSVYGLSVANNGGGTTGGAEIAFSPADSAKAGDNILLVRSIQAMNDYMNAETIFDFVYFGRSETKYINQNGDDAIELYFNGTVIETFGDVDVDGTGEDWEYTGAWAYKIDGAWTVAPVSCTAGSITTWDSSCVYPLAQEKAIEVERSQVNNFKSRYNSQREWRGFCLCSASMFVNGDAFTEMCFEDLRLACSNGTDYFGNGLCELLSAVDEGSVSNTFMNTMDYEVKKKCKHPYRSEGPEFLLFFKDTMKADDQVLQVMGSSQFDGNMFSELTEEQAQYIGLPLHFYRNLLDVKKYMIMNGKTVPYSVGREAVNQVSTVEASMHVNDVFDINEKEFTFQAAFTLSFAWTDENMWSDCMGMDGEVDEGVCQWVWRPNPRWKNARELIVLKKSLSFMPAYKSAFYILECRGKFSTPMSFHKFPRDKQSLLIEFSLEPSEGTTSDSLYENFRFSPVTAFSNSNTEGDTISGWFLQSVDAREEKKVRTHEKAFLFNKSNSTVWSDVEGEMERLFGKDYLLPVEYVSSVIVSIEVERVTSYYMLNFTLVAAMLASMSMVCFFLSPDNLSDRATLSLTIILALNVFQLVMNSSMPDTGYLTSLTTFIIASTLFVAFVTIESVVVYILHRRTVMRDEVRKFGGSLSLESNSVVPVRKDGTDVEEAEEGKVAEGKGVGGFLRRARGRESLVYLAGKKDSVEKLLAYNLDNMCIAALPAAYTLMTVIVFDIIIF